MKLFYELRLLTDAAVTRRSATVGGHESLSWVPGQSILGAAASRLYASLAERDLAWKVFHCGEVHFGDARPVVRMSPGWPVPMSLHHPKGSEGSTDGSVNGAVVNALRHSLGGQTQWKQLRDLFIGLDGTALESPRRRSMRTAMGATGQARDGYLFELEALPAGTVLRGVIEGPNELVEVLCKALDQREIRVGRSRSAEFGRALFNVIEEEVVFPRSRDWHQDVEVSVWCLSDLCVRSSETDQPTLVPTAAHFGLPKGWRYDPSRSFARTRRYTPFNGHRRVYDMERQVICAGSVLSFRAERGLDEPAWQAVQALIGEGVGEHLAEGLGVVVFEPVLLTGTHPVWEEPAARQEEQVNDSTTEIPKDDLGRWLEGECNFHRAEVFAWEQVRLQLETMRKARRAWEQVPNAQWGEVRMLARRHRGAGEDLQNALRKHVGLGDEKGEKTDRSSSPRGARARIWSTWRDGVQPAKGLCTWFEDVLKQNAEVAPMALELLSTHFVRARKGAK